MMTVHSPMIPYVTSIPGGSLKVGSLIIVHGQPTFNSNRFSVNLVHQGNMQCIFHFNARFDQGQVVRNTNYPSSSWGHEERSALPFAKNKPFFLEIRCLQDRFMVCHIRVTNGKFVFTTQNLFVSSQLDFHALSAYSPVTSMAAFFPVSYVHTVRYLPRFSVSLVCGPQPEVGAIAFQLTAHFDTSWVIRNSKLNHEWGVEEGTATRKFPFRHAQLFKLEIFICPSAYLIAIDGNHHCEYAHRVSYSEANTLQIIGDIQVRMIEFKSANTFPSSPAFPSGNRLNVTQPPVPFSSLINGALSVGNEIQVHGQVKPHPTRFHINLQQGCQTYPSPTVVFHFNPRYAPGNRVIVMNSLLGGQWGSEQRISAGRNLAPGTTFVLSIRRKVQNFEVLINGTCIATYAHRIAADIVDSVSIDGDVILHKVVAI